MLIAGCSDPEIAHVELTSGTEPTATDAKDAVGGDETPDEPPQDVGTATDAPDSADSADSAAEPADAPADDAIASEDVATDDTPVPPDDGPPPEDDGPPPEDDGPPPEDDGDDPEDIAPDDPGPPPPPETELDCDDELDDDGDGLFDCADPDCAEACLPAAELDCNDGLDNDGDLKTDCLDEDCAEACLPEAELDCTNDVDDDGDGLADCADPDCAAACLPAVEEACANGADDDGDGKTDCVDSDCDDVGFCEYGGEITCDDGSDNDGDGDVDCTDTNCKPKPPCQTGQETICDDGLDNDGDGKIDCLDASCHGKDKCQFGAELTCKDGFDNDSDGVADCFDSDCDGLADCEFGNELSCDDGKDNDTDILVDCIDPDCDGVDGCELGKELTCDDEVDNDADGKLDCLDPDCDGVDACELGAETTCDDSADNDADGFPDCLDSDCDGVGGCEVGKELTCDDGLDNDTDAWTDCADADCADLAACEYGTELSCGDTLDNDGDLKTDCEDPDCFTCNGACCGPGWSCEFGTCKIICSDTAQCGDAGDICCAEGEVCVSGTCATPSGECEFGEDCPDGLLCEPVIGQCIPEELVEICEFVPPVGVLTPEIGCHWAPPKWAKDPNRDNVCMNPVVANLTDDNGDGLTDTDDIPDIVFTAWDHAKGGCCDEPATVWVVSGKCNPDGSMTTHAELASPDLDESAGLALGDLNGDGIPEIVGMKLIEGAIAYERVAADGSEWKVLWENDTYPVRGVHTTGGAQPSLADLDGDGFPEVVVGNVVLNGTDGTLRWDGAVTSAGTGGVGNNAFLGPVSTVADIDLKLPLAPEVIAGNTAYDKDGNVLWTFTYDEGGFCQGSLPCDGFNAVGNFDDDDQGEVVIVRQGEIFIIEHDGVLKHKIPVPWDDCKKGGKVANESGPPTIADFDGDGKPEIGTAGADFYVVADLQCVGKPLPKGCASKWIRWKTANKDCSSRATASSVFDFEGDGKAEVVYADETTFRILDGKTGKVLFQDDTHGSNTRVEMPVIADVDNDGSAEVIIPENQNGGGTPGIEVWEDADGNWVRSRRIWNQHSYHITNISETGTVPAYETPNWLDPKLNNFRQNIQPVGVHFAPDLFVEAIEVTCGAEVLVTACIGNQGTLGVPAGILVTGKVDILLAGEPGGGPTIPLAAAATSEPILVGQCTPVSWSFPIPPEVTYDWAFEVLLDADVDGTTNGAFNECDEDNTETLSGTCPYVTP